MTKYLVIEFYQQGYDEYTKVYPILMTAEQIKTFAWGKDKHNKPTKRKAPTKFVTCYEIDENGSVIYNEELSTTKED